MENGKWKFGDKYETIILIIKDEDLILAIKELGNNEFSYIVENIIVKHIPYKFDYWGLY